MFLFLNVSSSETDGQVGSSIQPASNVSKLKTGRSTPCLVTGPGLRSRESMRMSAQRRVIKYLEEGAGKLVLGGCIPNHVVDFHSRCSLASVVVCSTHGSKGRLLISRVSTSERRGHWPP